MNFPAYQFSVDSTADFRPVHFYDSFSRSLRFFLIASAVLLAKLSVAKSFVGDPENNNSTRPSGLSVTAPSVVYPKPLTIDSISEAHVCGKSAEGLRVCIGNVPASIAANDSISKLQSFIAGGGHFCGRDERGVHCWQTEGLFEKDVSEILSEGVAERARFSQNRICIPQKDQTIRCYQPETGRWISTEGGGNRYETFRPKMETYGPFADLRDFRIMEQDICLLEGEAIVCVPFVNKDESSPKYSPRDRFPTGPFKGARSIVGTWNSFCVLSDAGLSCAYGREASERKNFEIGGEWTSATDLQVFGYDGYCARDKSGAPICIRIDMNSQQVSNALPMEYRKAGIEFLKYDIGSERLCALTRESKNGATKFSCFEYNTVVEYPAMNQITNFKIGSDSICALDGRGWVQCFSGRYSKPSPLPEDGSEINVAGLCRWNKTRFHCASTEIEDFGYIKKVIAVSQVASDELPCVIYENNQDILQVKCFGSQQSWSKNAPLVETEMTKITSNHQSACLYGGAKMACWGAEIGGPMPNLNSVKKLLFGADFACASDYFGFLCWGKEIESRNLVPPSNLNDIDFVQDFALGDEHVCAITRESRLECWGKNSAGQLNAPMLSNPSSVAIAGKTTCASSDQGVTCWGSRLDSLTTK